MEEDKDGKLICERILPFAKPAKKLWIQFPDMESYQAKEAELFAAIAESEGEDSVVIYVRNPKSIKELPRNRNVRADEELLTSLYRIFGEENVKVVAK